MNQFTSLHENIQVVFKPFSNGELFDKLRNKEHTSRDPDPNTEARGKTSEFNDFMN